MRRYNGQEIIDATSDDGDGFAAGDYYLVEIVPERGGDRYELRDEPGRTNMSCEPRVTGWLGTTDNVARYGRGCVRVTRDARGRVHIRPIAESVLAAAEETAAAV